MCVPREKNDRRSQHVWHGNGWCWDCVTIMKKMSIIMCLQLCLVEGQHTTVWASAPPAPLLHSVICLFSNDRPMCQAQLMRCSAQDAVIFMSRPSEPRCTCVEPYNIQKGLHTSWRMAFQSKVRGLQTMLALAMMLYVAPRSVCWLAGRMSVVFAVLTTLTAFTVVHITTSMQQRRIF